MSTTLAGAALTVFMGVSSTFGNVQSATYSMSYWPSMENCIKAIDDEIASMPKSFTIEKAKKSKSNEYAMTATYGKTTIAFLCRPQS